MGIENMKNVKYLGFVGLGCAALLLTGCGGESSNSGTGSNKDKDNTPVRHVLTCTKTEGTDVETLEYEFNDKEDKVEGVKMIMTSEVPEGVSDDDIKEAKDYLEELLCSDGVLTGCNTSVKGNKLQFEATVTSSGLEDEEFKGSKQEIKSSLESDGYSCK